MINSSISSEWGSYGRKRPRLSPSLGGVTRPLIAGYTGSVAMTKPVVVKNTPIRVNLRNLPSLEGGRVVLIFAAVIMISQRE